MRRIKSFSYICSLVALLVSNSIFSQNIQVTGFIKDSLSGNAESFNIVQFYKAEDTTKLVAYTSKEYFLYLW